MNKLKILLCMCIMSFIICTQALQAQTVVNPGDDLHTVIQNSNSGGTITVNSGTYEPLLIAYKNFSAANPLIIKAAAGANVTIKRSNWNRKNPHTQSYDAAVFTECSYIAFDGIKFTGDGQSFSINDRGVWIHDSHHMIFRNCEFTETQQEGVKVEATSEYVDFIDCLFADTGLGVPWFGEGLYVGRGSYGANDEFPDASKYVWVEGCEFHHTGRAEAINIKAEVFHCTIKNNYIHDITLNQDGQSQTNEGAISLDHTVGPGDNYRVGERRENWVENNTVQKIRSGKSGQRIAGIYSAGTGNNIIGNTVNDVTNGSDQSAANGIRFNNWNNDNTQNIIWNNTITNAENGNYFGNLAINQNPGNNPNNAQNWYPSGGGNSLSWNPTPTSISNGNNQIALNYSINQAGIVVVRLYDANWNYITQVYENVAAGAGQSNLTLVTNNLSAGSYILQGDLLNSSWGNIGVGQLNQSVSFSNNKMVSDFSQNIYLSPNPANQSIELTYEISENTQAQIQIYDAFGKSVKHITEVELLAGAPIEIEVAQLPAGIYYYSLQSNKWQAIKKFVIAR